MKKVEWVLVMNETRARVVRGLPVDGEPARAELVLRAEARKLRDIMSDKPGRSFSSGSGGRRSAIDYGGDPLRQDQIDFVHQTGALLEAHRRAGEFDTLAVVAAPHMLGLLREELSKVLTACISKEISKNLAGIAETELPSVLRRELAAARGT